MSKDIKEIIIENINNGKYDDYDIDKIDSAEEAIYLGGLLAGVLEEKRFKQGKRYNPNIMEKIKKMYLISRPMDTSRALVYFEKGIFEALKNYNMNELERNLYKYFINYNYGDEWTLENADLFMTAKTMPRPIQAIVEHGEDFAEVRVNNIRDLQALKED